MKASNRLYSLIALFAILAGACEPTPSGGDGPADEISFSAPEVSIGADAGKAVVTLTSSGSWRISGTPSWLGSVKPSSGASGTHEITVSGRFYDSKEPREGVVTATCGEAKAELKVVQSGVASLKASPSSIYDIPADGAEVRVEVESDAEYTVDLSEVAGWVTLDTNPLPLNGSVAFKVARNGSAPRSGRIVFKSGADNVFVELGQQGDAQYLERKALEELYDSTRGSTWGKSTNWKSDKPVGEWFGVRTDTQGRVVSLELESNNLEGRLPEALCRLSSLTTLRLSGNRLSGSLPEGFRLLPGWDGFDVADNLYPQQDGFGFSFADGETVAYAKASEGRGYDIIVLGDGFDKNGLRLGQGFDALVDETLDALFSIEPLSSIRSLFNVYAVAAESLTSQITTSAGNTAFGTYFISDSFSVVTMNTDKDKVASYAGKAPVRKLSDALVILLVNTTRFGGTTLTWSDGMKVCIVPAFRGGSAGNTEAQYGFAGLLHHECIGHGIGMLDEEYHTNGQTAPPTFASELSARQSSGSSLNISSTSDPAKVPWAALMGRSGVGVFEGAGNYSYGVWRSEQNCCMVDNRPYFSLWCRYLVWKRVRTVAGLDASLDTYLAG